MTAETRIAEAAESPWRSLTTAEVLETSARAWTRLMLARAEEMAGVGAVACTAYLIRDGRPEFIAAAPEARAPGSELNGAAQSAHDQARAVVRGRMPEPGRAGAVAAAVPLEVDGAVLGIVGLEMRPDDRATLSAAMRNLQWGAAWMRDALRAEQARADATRHAQAVNALNSVVSVAERDAFATAARAAVTDLATRFRCDRVSVGFRRFGRTKVAAVSHSAQFSRRMALIRQLAGAMDEAVDQRATLLWPEETDVAMTTQAHAQLGRAQGTGHIFTVPLWARDSFVGALTFERPASRPFTQDELDMLEAVATVTAPVLEEKRRADRWLIAKAGESLRTQFARLVGPGYLGRKGLLVLAAALVALFWFARTEYRVSADARVEGAVQRVVAPAFDGFVAEAPVRPGDRVAEGDLLVRLDDRDLALERLRLVTARAREQIEYDRAVAARDRAETRIRQSQIEQVDAQIALIDEQLARTRLTAPFDGLVVAGDLSQAIGSAVDRGAPLLTIAPDDTYRITLEVDERQIREIAVGQGGELRVTALPERSFPFEISAITPVARYRDGATVFEVEATPTGDTDQLRPGMDGAGRVLIDADRRVIAIWTQPIRDWLRLRLWSLGLVE
ncbi:HlyD family efflux transporter periplasmic adaptor subunit [Roseobacter sp. HKCCA0434]|uniref:HlyD family efflux transporter periplasmic adaptor subunit n=1 Tax=Roseobacter sp. HKCCA0434 TaxID=3079297 RepID=UPI00290591F3|nr:HlyD family efflux transporter periplasmic adaptor subunit [Roseobacter sp. HKCCA0434]